MNTGNIPKINAHNSAIECAQSLKKENYRQTSQLRCHELHRLYCCNQAEIG